MKTFATNITDEEVRKAVRYWVDLLGRGKFSDAADMLLPEIIPANGSVDEKEHLQWTGQLIEAVIHYGGTPFPYEGQDEFCKAAVVDKSFQEKFEKHLIVEREPFVLFDKKYLGGVHVDLPIKYEDGSKMSDLTARLYLRDLENGQMAFVLEDIHVM
jgi:hypothetical protein